MMDSGSRAFTLRLEFDFDWGRGLPVQELYELLESFGRALEAHFLEGVASGEFAKPSDNFPPSWLGRFAVLEFDPVTGIAVLAPPTLPHLRPEAELALDNLASLLDAFTAKAPLAPPVALALQRCVDSVGFESFEISLTWRGESKSVIFDETSLGWLQPLVRRLWEEGEYVYVNTALPWLRTEIRGLHWASQETAAQLRTELARLGFTVYELDGSRMTDDRSCYEEAERAGLADGFWGEWNFEPTQRSAIIWSRADRSAASDPRAFVEHVIEILRQIEETEKQVNLFLLGEPADLFPPIPSHPRARAALIRRRRRLRDVRWRWLSWEGVTWRFAFWMGIRRGMRTYEQEVSASRDEDQESE
jgi:hypothetical protein